MVLRRGAQHGRAADVDVLDRVGEAAIRIRHRLLERIEVDDQQVDPCDAMLAHRVGVGITPREQSCVDLRMKRLHAAVHHLREPGVRRDLDDRHPGVAKPFRGAAG